VIDIPLSLVGSAEDFAAALEAHRAAVEAHMMGKPGVPAPRAGELVEQLVQRQADKGPVADRGPDKIVIAPYRIIDDTPVPAEVQQALDTLRKTIAG
jgi:hypothetical protein